MTNDIKWLKKFQVALIGSLFGVSTLSLLIKQDVHWLLSVIAGGVFIIINFLILKRIVELLLGGVEKLSKFQLVGFIVFKLISFLAMLGVGVYFFSDEIFGFIMGISIIFIAAFVVALQGLVFHAS